MSRLLNQFADPDSRYRGKPFWAWNGELKVEEVVRQIHVMKRMGMGGFFMHSRVGLATPFLGTEWFEVVDACVEAARGLGMEAWLYDEDRWPSGAGGGLVTRDPRFRLRHLQLTVTPPGRFRKKGDELAVFTARVRPGALISDVRPYHSKRLPSGPGARVLAFHAVISPESSWFNGATYLDTMSPAAVDRFIEVAYEPYRKHYAKDFGGVMPGVFSDEPNHGHSYVMYDNPRRQHVFQSAWTDKLPGVFRKRYGYDIRKHLPELFFDIEGQDVSKARHDYHDCTTHLFVESFGKRIGRWCGKHGLMFTGHALCEVNQMQQTSVGGSTMRFYEHMQAPGIDILTEEWHERTTAKQCASVLHQMGRQWMLSELYGCTGWDFPLEGHKAVGDWQTALGVNLRSLHLSWYTMLGQAKRDYPASISFQSPWWRDYPVVEDYFSRLHVLLSRGEPVRDVLVVHNIESTWLRYRVGCNADGTGGAPGNWLEDLQAALLELHIDFDYVDEEMLPRLAKVGGRGERARLRVGKAVYRAVIVPRALTLRGTTLKVLERFVAAGGAVLFVEEPTAYVDCEPSDRARRLADRGRLVPLRKEPLAAALNEIVPQSVSITDAAGREIAPALYMLRRDGKRHYLFICNTDRQHGFDSVAVSVAVDGQAQEWDPTDGTVYRTSSKRRGGRTLIRTRLPPSGSRLLVFDAGAKPLAPATVRRPEWREVRRQRLGGTDWPISRDEPNAVVLDRPRYRFRDGRWYRPDEVLRVDKAIREAVGLTPRGGQMLQPWVLKDRPPKDMDCPVELRYRFDVEAPPAGPMHLVVERPERFEIRLNGNRLTAEGDEGWWVDSAMRRLCVAPWMLRAGRNELAMAMRYTDQDPGLEAVFLTGEFGVRLQGRTPLVIEAPTRLAVGDWTVQGLPFYSGAVTYGREIQATPKRGEAVFLTLPGLAASVVRVRVDGQAVGAIAWPPHEIDLTDVLKRGPHRLQIDVVSSRRNLLGPLHWHRPGRAWVGPAEFQAEGKAWSDDYVLVPYGLLKPPVLSYRRKT